MPEPPLDTIQESMRYHVDGSSLEGAAILFTASGGAPSRPGGSPLHYASDSDDNGKAVVAEGDPEVSGGTCKELMNAASSSSSSSSTLAETEDVFNNVAGDSSSQHDEAEAEGTTDVFEAENRTDAPEVLAVSTRSLAITPMNESDNHYYWRNQQPRLFEDTPEQADISSGLGYHDIVQLMGLTEESQHDTAPLRVQDPEDLLMGPSTSIVTFQVPGFSMGLAGGIVPFAEEQCVEDPDDVGLENLDIFYP